MLDRIQSALPEVLSQSLGEGYRLLGDVTNISSGWESEIYSFEVSTGDSIEQAGMVLRLFSGPSGRRKAEWEFRSMQALLRSGYPVPKVYTLELDPSRFGKPFFIMERIEGSTMMDRMLQEGIENPARWTQMFSELFVRLHRLDWKPFVEDPSVEVDPYLFIDRWLENARQNTGGLPQFDFQPLIDWIQRRRSELACPRPSPTHQDFHPMNILIQPDGSPSVIDWTSFGVTDFRFDLAWTLVLTHGHASSEARQAYLQEYQRAAGGKVEKIEVFEVLACARRLFDVTTSLTEGAESRGMRPEAVELMRQMAPAQRRIYNLLVDHTGIRLEPIEKLLDSM